MKEKTDGLWALPGGYADVWADVGLSAAQNIRKEISEETQIDVRVTTLYAIKHKAQHDYDQDVRDFYKLFFFCEQIDKSIRVAPGMEGSDAQFFRLEDLPPLSTGRVNLNDIKTAFDFSAGKLAKVLFD